MTWTRLRYTGNLLLQLLDLVLVVDVDGRSPKIWEWITAKISAVREMIALIQRPRRLPSGTH